MSASKIALYYQLGWLSKREADWLINEEVEKDYAK